MAEEKQHGPLFTIFLVLIVLCIFIWAIWAAFNQDLMLVVKWLCIAEAWFFDLFVDDPKLGAMIDYLLPRHKGSLDFKTDMVPALYLVGKYMRFIFIPALGFMTYQAFMHPPRKMLRYPMGLDALIKYQSKSWHYIRPFVDYDPGRESSRSMNGGVPKKLKKFAEALSPIEWLVYQDIDVDADSYEFDEAKAKKKFQSQLGKRWRGTLSMPDYQRALLAAFALKGARKREESDELLGEISMCWSRKLGFSLDKKLKRKIDKLIKTPAVGHEAIKVGNNYAYINSSMLGILDWARKRGGVLAPAQFLWLRGVDRDMWYALNSLGRRTYFSEGSGSISHYYFEKSLEKPLVTINVDRAIEALKDYLEDQLPEIPVKE